MATDANIRLPDDLLAKAERVTRNGKTADDLAAEAVRKEISRRLVANLPSKASGMTEEEEIESSLKAVHEYRRGR